MMKERPILFSAPMVRALLDGSKTQTRRVCKPAEAAGLSYVVGIQDPRDFGQRPLEVPGSGWFGDEEGDVQFRSPHGKPGDRLWVRESWRVGKPHDKTKPVDILPPLLAAGKGVTVLYEAGGWRSVGPEGRDEPIYPDDEPMPDWAGKGRPSIHMPRAFSRIQLEVVSVRVERLNDISEVDAQAEGATYHKAANHLCHAGWSHDGHYLHETALASFGKLWESINGAGSWAAKPWAWVIEFKRVLP